MILIRRRLQFVFIALSLVITSVPGTPVVARQIVSAAATSVTFDAGSLIIPMDTTYQDFGMLKAFGLVDRLLRAGIPVAWCIQPGKAFQAADFTASAVDLQTNAVITAYGYRGGPFVIAASDAVAAQPIVAAWQTSNPTTKVHAATAQFTAPMRLALTTSPRIAVLADGNEEIAFGYLNAAGILDENDLVWGPASVDLLTPAQVAGPSTTSTADGALFLASGQPAFSVLISLHWVVTSLEIAAVVPEIASFLQFPVHLLAECASVNAIEGAPPTGGQGDFLTTQGFAYPGPGRPSAVQASALDLPFAQFDGPFGTVGGSQSAFALAAGSTYYDPSGVMLRATGQSTGIQDVWVAGYVHGTCPIASLGSCADAGPKGTVSYLGGHQYGTQLPVSAQPTTQGTRLFLNALFAGSNPNRGEMIQNGDFSDGTTNWLTFAQPAPGDIVFNTTGGVFQFYRTGTQATVFQQTGIPVASGAPVEAAFDLGNSTTARKRISILLQDADFSDLSVCTFWLEASTPLATYRMRSHTTKTWTSATVAFYAANPGNEDSGFYRIDNVSVKTPGAASASRTECVDPTAPVSGGVTSGELLLNGTFTSGTTSWLTFGNLSSQVSSGVFEFFKLAGLPAGTIFQNTGQAMANDQRMTATFQLGNSSGIRQRVTILAQEGNFTDLAACTFWIPPGQGLSNYALRTYATKAWTNATLSVYPASVGTAPTFQWLQLDNVSLTQTTAAVLGTECIEPGGSLSFAQGLGGDPLPRIPGRGRTMDGGARGPAPAGSAPNRSAASGAGWRSVAAWTGTRVLHSTWPIDLRNATTARLTFQSWLSPGASSGEVQVSVDGAGWQTVAAVPMSDAWSECEIDLSAFAGQVVQARFVFHAVAPAMGAAPDTWQIGDIRVDASAHGTTWR